MPMASPSNRLSWRSGVQALALAGLAGLCAAPGATRAEPALPDLPDVSGDLAALPDAASDGGWTGQETRRPLRFGLQAGARRTALTSPAARLGGDHVDTRFAALTLALDAEPLPGMAVTGLAYVLTEDGETRTGLHDLTVTWRLGDSLQLGLGKTYPAWSFSELAHVLDPALDNAARIDREDLTTEYAHPYAGMRLSFGNQSLHLLVMDEGHDIARAGSDSALTALRWQAGFGKANLSAHALRRADGTRELGFGLDLAAGQTLLSFEASHADRHRLPLVQVLPNGAALTAPEAGGAWQATLAARRPLGENWQVEGLYLYNGQGYDAPQWRAALQGEAAVLAAMQAYDFTHAGYLTAARSAHDGQFLRRNYLAASLSSRDGLLPWGITLGAYAGLDDGGGFAFASIDRRIGSAGTLSLDLSGGFGPTDSEFARRPDTLSLVYRMEF